nr:VOC family protein [Actinomycetota bacterium]
LVTSVRRLLDRPISHVSYVVEDIPTAVERWISVLGAGPFFLLERVKFDVVKFEGRPAVFDHSAAFGQWGSVAIELQQFYSVSPSNLEQRLRGGSAPQINHTAYISSDAAADSAELNQAGMPAFLYAKSGPVEVTFHDVPWLGHAVEIHRRCDFIVEFFAGVEAAARDWDGGNPLRYGAPNG